MVAYDAGDWRLALHANNIGDKVVITRGKKDPDIVAEGRWARWTGAALRRPGLVLTIGLVLLGALIVPSIAKRRCFQLLSLAPQRSHARPDK